MWDNPENVGLDSHHGLTCNIIFILFNLFVTVRYAYQSTVAYVWGAGDHAAPVNSSPLRYQCDREVYHTILEGHSQLTSNFFMSAI